MQMSNKWNKQIYRLWAPVYDATIGRAFLVGRKRAVLMLDPKPGERILLVGVGTGADLPFLPWGVHAVGLDFSYEMLSVAQRKLPTCSAHIQLLQADAQQPVFATECFDALVLNLVLSVVPDGSACLGNALRVLKPGGRIVIFDKFLPESTPLIPLYHFINVFTTLLGTDITRRFSALTEGSCIQVVDDQPGMLGSMYRVILLKKPGGRG